jgi:hypothetical protein
MRNFDGDTREQTAIAGFLGWAALVAPGNTAHVEWVWADPVLRCVWHVTALLANGAHIHVRLLLSEVGATVIDAPRFPVYPSTRRP